MKCCPQCGAGRSGETDYRVHTRTREDTDIRTDGGQGPTDGRGGDQNGQPPQGGRGQQPQQGGQRGQPGGQQRGSPPAGGQAGRGDDGVDRRTLLLGGGGVLAVLGGGWFFFLRDDGSPTDSPEAVVEAYYGALDNGDFERVDELTHNDSPYIRTEEAAKAFGEAFEQAEISVERTSTTDIEGYEASQHDSVQAFEGVEAEVSYSFEDQSGPVTETSVAAQNPDGEWKLWNIDI
jgi:hypothetical protein